MLQAVCVTAQSSSGRLGADWPGKTPWETYSLITSTSKLRLDSQPCPPKAHPGHVDTANPHLFARRHEHPDA
jgi:hypothetical protein